MKKLFTLLLTGVMVLSLTACGGNEEPASTESTTAGTTTATQTESAPPAQQGQSSDLSGFYGTKTGKFYSQFADGKMYMKYETEYEGQKMTMISAINGNKLYTENTVGGSSAGAAIMDGEYMYTIDHSSKMVIKMPLQMNSLNEIAGNILEESDVDMNDYKKGTRTIDGKAYDTEEWKIEGSTSIMCFDGNDLAYMISEADGKEFVIKVIETSANVDSSLFEIPSGYQVMSLG